MKIDELEDNKWYDNPNFGPGIPARGSYWKNLLERALDAFDMDLVACLDKDYKEYKNG